MYISNSPDKKGKESKYIIRKLMIAYHELTELCSIPFLYYTSYDSYILDAMNDKNARYSKDCHLGGFTQNKPNDNNERLEKLNDIKIYDLYEENGIIQTINKSDLINYGYDIQHYFGGEKYLSLYARYFFGLDKKCLKDRLVDFDLKQLDELKELQNEIDKKGSLAGDMRQWGSWAKGLMSISESLNLLSSFQMVTLDYKILLFYLISLGFNIGNLIQTTKANDIDDAFQGDFSCSDETTNDIYNIMTSKINESGRNIRITNYFIIASAFFVIVLLILNLIKICIERKKKEEEGKEKNKELVEKKGVENTINN